MQELFPTGVDPAPGSVPRPRRRWLSRLAVPSVILVALLSLLAYALRDELYPAASVAVVRVVVRETPSGETGGPAVAQVSVQAPGWVEPDPYPIYVSGLAAGIVEEVLVLEGERVAAGQVVARLVATDAQLAVRRASAALRRAEATSKAARTDLEQPVALKRAVAVQRASLEEARTETGRLEAQVLGEQIVMEGLRRAWERLRALSTTTVSRQTVEDAEYAFLAQQAKVETARRTVAVARATAGRFEAELAAATQVLRLKVAEHEAVGVAEARVQETSAALDEARLRLQRMEVVSPSSGVVMARLAVPGGKLIQEMDDPHSAHVVHLYDPARLQVRVDIPLADAARVGVGQEALIVVDVLPDREFRGRVTRFVHQADISKNTVQAKVAILDPDPLLKPDMLARVKFLGTPSAEGGEAPAGLQVLAPLSAMQRQGDRGVVWRIDPATSRLQRLEVGLGGSRGDGWVLVAEGLRAGDALVDQPGDGLQEGRRVRALQEGTWP